jgi:hypothetical protein
MLHSVMRASHAPSRTFPITYPSFSATFGESKPRALAPEAAAELTQGDEQPGSKVRRLRIMSPLKGRSDLPKSGPKRRDWPITKFFRNAKLGRCRGTAEIEQAAPLAAT